MIDVILGFLALGRHLSSKKEQNQSLTKQAYSQLRNDIVCIVFPQQAKLNIESLKKSYNMGGTPIREALNQLVAEKMVTALPLRGFQVAAVTPEQLADIYNNRALIEKEMLQQVMAKEDDFWESQCVASLYRIKKSVANEEFSSGDDVQKWLKLSAMFYNNLLGAVESDWLRHIQGLLYMHSQRYESLFCKQIEDLNAYVKKQHRAFKQLLNCCLANEVIEAVSMHENYLHKQKKMLADSVDLLGKDNAR